MITKIFGSAGLASVLMTGVAAAQTTTTMTSSSTPGVPNTGAGDIVINVMILAISALVAVGGALYLYMNRRVANE